MKIFYCDDDTDDVEIFEESINRIDPTIQLVVHNDPDEALEELVKASQKPDFIFFDYAMIELNVDQCLSELREHDDLKNIPIVVLSGRLDKYVIEKLNGLGICKIIDKNYPEDLEKSIRLALEWQSG